MKKREYGLRISENQSFATKHKTRVASNMMIAL